MYVNENNCEGTAEHGPEVPDGGWLLERLMRSVVAWMTKLAVPHPHVVDLKEAHAGQS